MNKLIVILTTLHLSGINTCTHTALLIPTFRTITPGSYVVKWFGFETTASLGKLVTGLPTDGGLTIKILMPKGIKALVTMDAGIHWGKFYGHTMIGTETAKGPGISAGIGGTMGMSGIRWGLCGLTATKATRNKVFRMGAYSDQLIQLSNKFLTTLDGIMILPVV